MARVREFDTAGALAAAVASFRRHGYEGTSIQDLVEATGIGRGSLYTAFGSKDALYLAALERYGDDQWAALLEVLTCGASVREIVRAILVGIVDDSVKGGSHQACMMVGAAIERVQFDRRVAEKVRAASNAVEDALTILIDRGQAAGEVGSVQNSRDLARFLVATTQGLRVSGAIHPDRRWLMSVVDIAMAALD